MRGAALLVFATLVSCGPSYRKLARSEWVYDECEAIDADPYVHPDTKRQCWQYWLARHNYHQPNERVGYARGRAQENAMLAAQPPPPESAGGAEMLPPGAPPPPGGEPPIVAPGPGSAAPPGGSAAPAGPSCPEQCRQLWRRCRGACGQRAAASCTETCDGVLADCIGDCR